MKKIVRISFLIFLGMFLGASFDAPASGDQEDLKPLFHKGPKYTLKKQDWETDASHAAREIVNTAAEDTFNFAQRLMQNKGLVQEKGKEDQYYGLSFGDQFLLSLLAEDVWDLAEESEVISTQVNKQTNGVWIKESQEWAPKTLYKEDYRNFTDKFYEFYQDIDNYNLSKYYKNFERSFENSIGCFNSLEDRPLKYKDNGPVNMSRQMQRHRKRKGITASRYERIFSPEEIAIQKAAEQRKAARKFLRDQNLQGLENFRPNILSKAEMKKAVRVESPQGFERKRPARPPIAINVNQQIKVALPKAPAPIKKAVVASPVVKKGKPISKLTPEEIEQEITRLKNKKKRTKRQKIRLNSLKLKKFETFLASLNRKDAIANQYYEIKDRYDAYDGRNKFVIQKAVFNYFVDALDRVSNAQEKKKILFDFYENSTVKSKTAFGNIQKIAQSICEDLDENVNNLFKRASRENFSKIYFDGIIYSYISDNLEEMERYATKYKLDRTAKLKKAWTKLKKISRTKEQKEKCVMKLKELEGEAPVAPSVKIMVHKKKVVAPVKKKKVVAPQNPKRPLEKKEEVKKNLVSLAPKVLAPSTSLSDEAKKELHHKIFSTKKKVQELTQKRGQFIRAKKQEESETLRKEIVNLESHGFSFAFKLETQNLDPKILSRKNIDTIFKTFSSWNGSSSPSSTQKLFNFLIERVHSMSPLTQDYLLNLSINTEMRETLKKSSKSAQKLAELEAKIGKPVYDASSESLAEVSEIRSNILSKFNGAFYGSLEDVEGYFRFLDKLKTTYGDKESVFEKKLILALKSEVRYDWWTKEEKKIFEDRLEAINRHENEQGMKIATQRNKRAARKGKDLRLDKKLGAALTIQGVFERGNRTRLTAESPQEIAERAKKLMLGGFNEQSSNSF